MPDTVKRVPKRYRNWKQDPNQKKKPLASWGQVKECGALVHSTQNCVVQRALLNITSHVICKSDSRLSSILNASQKK